MMITIEKGEYMKCKNIVMMCILITLMPNCGRVLDWGMHNFNQGKEVKYDRKLIKSYIKSIRIYDQIDTLGIFDVLWLSIPVRSAYAELTAQMHGKDEEKKSAFLRRQFEETRHFISFYVLSTYGIPLGETTSAWIVTLRIDDEVYRPIELKSVELPLEYKWFFSDHFNRFKLPYLLKFDAKDIQGNNLITEDTQTITLVFRSIDKEQELIWHIDYMRDMISD